MKYEIDSLVLDNAKTNLINAIADLKGLANEETSLINKTLINDCIVCIKQSHSNLELANKPKPIKKLGITSK